MQDQRYNNYQAANISTADRGKLIIMIYDHCIKWCKLAIGHIDAGESEKATKAIFKIQDGITELTCALDMDKGGEIANNLFNLYTFYNRHLSTALQQKETSQITEVQKMMTELRLSWVEAIEIVRKEDRNTIKEQPNNQIRMVG